MRSTGTNEQAIESDPSGYLAFAAAVALLVLAVAGYVVQTQAPSLSARAARSLSALAQSDVINGRRMYVESAPTAPGRVVESLSVPAGVPVQIVLPCTLPADVSVEAEGEGVVFDVTDGGRTVRLPGLAQGQHTIVSSDGTVSMLISAE